MRIALVPALLAVVLFSGGASARSEDLLGVWEGVDRASEAIYGEISITKTAIRWGGGSACKTSYTVASAGIVSTYPGAVVKSGETFETYEVSVLANGCTQNNAYFVFYFPRHELKPAQYEYAEVRVLDSKRAGVGWHRFVKKRRDQWEAYKSWPENAEEEDEDMDGPPREFVR